VKKLRSCIFTAISSVMAMPAGTDGSAWSTTQCMTSVRTLRESWAGLIFTWKNWPATRALAELGLHGAGAAALAAGVTAQGAEFRTSVIEALIGL
jgi:hypothetical protein